MIFNILADFTINSVNLIIKEIDTYNSLIICTLRKMAHTGFYRTLFLRETVTLFLSIK